jgi:hypothetical protein
MPNAKLPGATTFAGVGALILGLLGLCGSGLGLAGQAQQGANAEQMRAMQSQFGGDAGMGNMMDEMMAMQERMFLPTLAMQLVFFLAAIGLGAVGVFVLMRNARAVTLGPTLLFAVAGISVLGTGLEIWIQHASMTAMSRAFESGGGPGAAVMDGFMGMGLAFAYGCSGGWLLLKLGFVFWAAAHLRKPEIAGFFGGARALGPRGE